MSEETCRYEPDAWYRYYDEADNEFITREADPGCVYECSACRYVMMNDWFDEEPGPLGGYVYRPRFEFCPNCGRKVENDGER